MQQRDLLTKETPTGLCNVVVSVSQADTLALVYNTSLTYVVSAGSVTLKPNRQPENSGYAKGRRKNEYLACKHTYRNSMAGADWVSCLYGALDMGYFYAVWCVYFRILVSEG